MVGQVLQHKATALTKHASCQQEHCPCAFLHLVTAELVLYAGQPVDDEQTVQVDLKMKSIG